MTATPSTIFGKVALLRRLRDIGADAMRGDRLVLPLDIFGDDRGVPGAARSGDGAGEIIGQDAGQDDALPPVPAVDAKIRGRFAQIVGEGGRAGDHVEDDIPLRAEHDQQAEPDVRIEMEGQNEADRGAEQQIDRKGGEKLRERLNAFGDARPQADPDADRHPDDRRQRHQHDHAHQREEGQHERRSRHRARTVPCRHR